MKASLWYGLIGCGLVLLSLWSPAGQAVSRVVVLSFDGLRHDLLVGRNLPAFARVAREGAQAKRLTPVRPSNTFPGHVSMATGTYPDVHGIVDNHFIDRQRGRYSMSADADWIRAEPLWIAAERQGVPAATYFWVGSESDWRGQGTRYRIAPFDGQRGEREKLAQILDWLRLPADEAPRLIMSYWSGADRIGHRHGPEGDDVNAAILAQDSALAELLAGLDALDFWDNGTLLLVSDHGMTATGALLDVQGVLDDAGVAATLVGYTFGQVHLDDPQDLAAARAALEAKGWPMRILSPDALPEAWRVNVPGRMGDLVLTTEPPYEFQGPGGFQGLLKRLLFRLGREFGGHGYDPDLPDMGGIFLAMGRGVPAGTRLSAVHQVDVAPTVAALLGMRPPAQSEGRAWFGAGVTGEQHRGERAP